ncbi:unnamed protein product, partial [Ectocarpus sp. 6 AP-2014]
CHCSCHASNDGVVMLHGYARPPRVHGKHVPSRTGERSDYTRFGTRAVSVYLEMRRYTTCSNPWTTSKSRSYPICRQTDVGEKKQSIVLRRSCAPKRQQQVVHTTPPIVLT